jgi:hypothetical protein
MFHPDKLTEAALRTQAKELGCNQDILERCTYALILLGRLAESGLPFVFKGGTSLLLHLPEVRRLSIDIDIVCGEDREVVDAVVQQIGRQLPFTRFEPDDRQHRDLPHRRHFKFFYRSAVGARLEVPVLLDVVEENRKPYQLVTRPIQTSFLKPEKELLVQLPTVESLLGDKLTAFAPGTVGIPLRKANGQPGDLMQVAKQVFDVGVLFDAAADFKNVAATYDAVQQLESEYRDARPTREACLTGGVPSRYDPGFSCVDRIKKENSRILSGCFLAGRRLPTIKGTHDLARLLGNPRTGAPPGSTRGSSCRPSRSKRTLRFRRSPLHGKSRTDRSSQTSDLQWHRV